MQRPKTYALRGITHDILLQHGPMSLNALAAMIQCPPEELRYAIESTSPFEAVFKKYVDREAYYDAVPLDSVYGGEDFY